MVHFFSLLNRGQVVVFFSRKKRAIMKTITMDVLKDAANRLLFDLNDEQYKTLYEEFQTLKKQMEKIGEIKGLDQYEPMTFPFDCSTSYLREDELTAPLSREDVLKNAHNVKDGQIKLPKVVQ